MRGRAFVLFLLLAAASVFSVYSGTAGSAEPPFSSPFAPGIFPALSPDEIKVLQEAAQRKELTPEARQVIQTHPELSIYLPSDLREELEAEEAGADNVANLKMKREEEREKKGKEETEKEKVERKRKEPPAPYDWKKSVYVSRLFLSRLKEEEAKELLHFGHELFDPRLEGPVVGDIYPVSDDYVVGPGDELIVRVWGRMEATHRLRVDRDGKIFFPKFGSMYVAGKSFGEVKSFLRSKVGSVQEVFLDVSFGQLKGFQVSVLGEVQAPGRYQVTSYHTILQALMLAGGVKDIGSLRRVQVKRGKETAAEIDIYDFLLKGDVTGDTRLRAGDVIFTPVAGPFVAVTGEVRRQAIYELKEKRTIREVVAMAGGLSPSAYNRRVQVERLEGNRARVIVDLDLEAADQSLASFGLQDGDILRILAVLPQDENVVEIEGNVERPGKYEWKPGLTVGSLITDEKFFLPSAYLDYALITRLVGPERRKEALPVNLRKAIIDRDPAADVALQPMDKLMVFRDSAFRDERTATVAGEVREPGEYEIFPGMRVTDLIMLGGNLTRNASLGEAELSRRDAQRIVTILKVSLEKALAGDPQQDVMIQDGDHLVIRPVPDLLETRYVTLAGEVRFPGVYAARKGERLSSILERAGGFTKDAFLKGAVFTRVSVQKRQQELIDRTVEQLEQEVARTAAREGATALDREDIEAQKQIFEARKALLTKLKQVRAQGRVIIRLAELEALHGTTDDLLIEHGDRLEVPRAAEVINVMGRVYNPTAVVYYQARDTVGYYLRKVGGPTEDADKNQIFVVKADGSVMTKDSINGGLWFFGGGDFMDTRVEPGDAIVVPEKLVFTRVMKDVKDITQILYQIAVTAGVLIVAF